MTHKRILAVVAMAVSIPFFACSNLLLEAESADERFVTEDTLELTLTPASGDDASAITQDIELPTSNAEGTTISWSSSNPAVMTAEGVVTRPAFDRGSVEVTLTATLTNGTAVSTKTFTYTILPLVATDAQAVAAAKAAIAIGYATGDSATAIRQNVTLPATGLWGTTVSWTLTAGIAIDPSDGTVTRPAYLAGNTTVSLRATVTRNATSDTKDFDALVIVRQPGTDAQCVAEDLAALAIGYAAGDSAASVTQALTLATSGSNETTISWASNNAAIAANGTVTRPAFSSGDAAVTLTATLTKAGTSDTKAFTVTVPRLTQTNLEAVADGKSSLSITYGGSDTASSVTVNLASLPSTSTSGTSVTWTTNDPAHVTAAGVVTRPAYGSGDATVTLIATITKAGASDTRTFTLTIMELPDPDIAAVDAAWDVLAITYGGVDTASSVTQSVTLPTTGTGGTSVSWLSSNNWNINSAGTLNNRNVNQDDPVTLTATITKGIRSRSKFFAVTVIRWPADVPTNWTVTPPGPLNMWVSGGQQEIRIRLTDWRGTYVPGRQVAFSTSLGVSDWYQPTGWIKNNSCTILTDSDGFAVTYFHPLNTGVGAVIWVSVPTGFGGNYLGPLTITVNSY